MQHTIVQRGWQNCRIPFSGRQDLRLKGTFTRTDGSYYDFLSPQQVANIKDSQDSISFLNSDGVIIEAVAAESTAKVPLLALYCVEDIPQCSVKPRNPLNKNKNENGTIVVPETIVNPKA